MAGMREAYLESGNGWVPMLRVIFETSPKVVSRGFWYSFLPGTAFSAVFGLALSDGFTCLLLGFRAIPTNLILLEWPDTVKTDGVSQYYHQDTTQW